MTRPQCWIMSARGIKLTQHFLNAKWAMPADSFHTWQFDLLTVLSWLFSMKGSQRPKRVAGISDWKNLTVQPKITTTTLFLSEEITDKKKKEDLQSLNTYELNFEAAWITALKLTREYRCISAHNNWKTLHRFEKWLHVASMILNLWKE